eukprot:Clim_evm8s180 gene=Clim_evmTU8s180
MWSAVVVLFVATVLRLWNWVEGMYLYTTSEWLYNSSSSENTAKKLEALEQDLLETKHKSKSVSPMDDFKEYALLGRQVNKLEVDVQHMRHKHKQGVNRVYDLASRASTWSRRAVYATTVFRYYRTPIFHLLPDMVWPIGYFLSIPTGIPNSMGVFAWLWICSTGVDFALGLMIMFVNFGNYTSPSRPKTHAQGPHDASLGSPSLIADLNEEDAKLE